MTEEPTWYERVRDDDPNAGEKLLENPFLWSAFHKRLSMGIDADHDAEAIRSFAKMLNVPPHRVLNKIRTYCHPSNGTIN